MLIAPLVGITLVAAAAAGPDAGVVVDNGFMTTQEKSAAMQPFVRAATECIARGVVADPQYGAVPDGTLAELIVKSVPPCAGRVRAMIRAYDGYFGEGSGAAFFRGPYLDLLPQAVNAWVEQLRQD